MNQFFCPKPLIAAAMLLCAPFAMSQATVSPAADSAASAASAPGVLTSFPPVKGVKINRAAFGVFAGLDTATPRIDPTNVVERDGSQIGWVVDLKADNAKVRWREEFVTPTPPQNWGLTRNDQDVRPPLVSADRRTAITERAVPSSGTISHWWKLDPSDPAGRHVMRVYVEDVLVASFEFDVR
jgi:hypothetical protein